MINIFSHDINMWAVLVCGILSIVIGFVWYMPQVLGDMWMKENSLDPKKLESASPINYVVSVVGFLVLGLVLAWFLKATSADTWMSALRVGLALWAGFSFAPTLTNYLFSQRSLKLVAIDTGYPLVCTVVFSLLIWAWK